MVYIIILYVWTYTRYKIQDTHKIGIVLMKLLLTNLSKQNMKHSCVINLPFAY